MNKRKQQPTKVTKQDSKLQYQFFLSLVGIIGGIVLILLGMSWAGFSILASIFGFWLTK